MDRAVPPRIATNETLPAKRVYALSDLDVHLHAGSAPGKAMVADRGR